jgi:Abnormal spindle-like microcephaly-assoc'd, ASPM-SPD-2-Hydin
VSRSLCGLLAVLACIAMTGCAGVSSSGQQSNSNPNPRNPDPPPSVGQLSVGPSTINFGTVALGGSANLTGTLTAGSSDIDVTSAAWSGQGYNVSGITFPVTVAAGKSVTYTVTFTPQVSGDSPGSVSFVNDGSTSPVAQTLDGSGGQAGAHAVGLSWDASTSSVFGYNVYRGTQSGGPYQRLTSSPQPGTSYTDATVLSGNTYYYVSTAVDSNLTESAYSNQAQAVVP